MFKFNPYQDETFIGFFDLKACNTLSLEPTYEVEIVQAELVGNIVHLLIEVWLKDEKQGLITEAYDVTGKEFYELVKNFFASEWGRVVSVTTECLTCVSGYAKLTKRNGQVAVDWNTLRDGSLSCGELIGYYEPRYA